MARPLELSYRWQAPVLIASVGLFACVGLVARGRAPGWVGVVGILVALWGMFLGVVWLRTRAHLEVDGTAVVVRRFRNLHRIEGADVLAVREYLTPNGPSYKLTVRTPDGASRRYVAPVALLRQGHATLFTWILAAAPQAELDRRSRRTLEELQVRGLVG